MIFRQSVVGAIVVLAVIALEGKVDFDPTPLTSQTTRRSGTGKYLPTPYF
jgi:ABC-type phosphate transport system auxiliary subunit